jgi:UDP-N-acetylmuramate--alanine ligase
MRETKSYFFCGVGGSGMLPLALIVKAKGADVAGSDRAYDSGRTPEKFAFLAARGIRLAPQDGSGVTRADQIVVTSAAVEESVPDVIAARSAGARLMRRADLLAELFNAAPNSVAVGGTSGKSTTTGMIAWVLAVSGRDPTVMNGAVMKNFIDADTPFASALVGAGTDFVSEVDESDGSIALYRPKVAVLTNIAFDHKSLEELRALFGAFVAAGEHAVINADNAEAFALVDRARAAWTFGFAPGAMIRAERLALAADGAAFDVVEAGARARVRIKTPGAHNVSNALGAIAACRALGLPLHDVCMRLEGFSGIRRRLELVGSAGGVTVIDDFAHNPDKIAATLATLHGQPGRVLVMFQPHGFGPLKLMRKELTAAFADHLGAEDKLIMPEPVYFGGTADRAVTSRDLAAGVAAAGRDARALETRAECGALLVAEARAGDRIIVMGARDDTLSTFAHDLLQMLANTN